MARDKERMTDAGTRVVELAFRFMKPESPGPRHSPLDPKPAVMSDADLSDFLEPELARIDVASVMWRLSDGEVFEVPFRDTGELGLTLEFEYVLDGREGVDRLVRQLDVAAALAIARDPSDLSIPRAEAVPGGIRRSLILQELTKHPALLARLEAPMAGVPWDVFFIRENEPVALVGDVSVILAPRANRKLLLMANDAVSAALAGLRARLLTDLRKLERVASGMLVTALDSARNEIYREALRYFDFRDEGGVEAAFSHYKYPLAKADNTSGTRSSASILAARVSGDAARLQEAVKRLKPFAQAVLDTEKALSQTSPYVNPHRPAGPNPALSTAKEAVGKARQELAREIGKFRDTYPVVLRMTPEEILRVPAVDRQALGAILFPILARAEKANRSMKSTATRWPMLCDDVKADVWPEVALYERLERDRSRGSIWRHRKYVERALARVLPDPASPGHAATQTLLDRLHGKNSLLEFIPKLAGEFLIFETAAAIDRRAQTDAAKKVVGEMAEKGAKGIFRFLPIVNWVFAGWHIYTNISEYDEQSDQFFCTLDPADSLIDLEPSFGALLEDIGTEVAFALV